MSALSKASTGDGEHRVLEGIRVLDFTRVLAGPYLTRHMRDMGAEVIKVEPPVTGEDSRHLPFVIRPGYSGYFMQQNCGKKSISLNLKHPRGKEIVADLVRISDVVVENFKPGVMTELKLDYPHLRRINPQMVMCSISGFGQFGPYSQLAGEVTATTALSGAVDPGGNPDGPPSSFRHAFGDMNAGAHALGAIGAALYYREKTGIGQYLDLSILDCMFSINEMDVQNFIHSDGKVRPVHYEHYHPRFVPRGDFTCKDGRYLYLEAYDDAGWARLVTAIDEPGLANDPRFATAEGRSENGEALYRYLAAWIGEFASPEEAMSVLDAHQVVAAPISSVAEAVRKPEINQREMLVEIEDPVVGKAKLTNSPYRFSDTVCRISGSPPLLGQHNEEVLISLLGYSAAEVAKLKTEKVLFAE